jgi:uncharacterized membrane protein
MQSAPPRPVSGEAEMLDHTVLALVFLAAIGSGVVAGIFYAFSTFVMAALGRLPAQQGAAAMNAINLAVINPLFMAAFFGTALVCLVLAAGSLWWWSLPGAAWVLAASLIYLAGNIGVTAAFNIPLNNQLAAGTPAEAAAFWPRYLAAWSGWNHVRTVTGIVSAVLFTAALAQQR